MANVKKTLKMMEIFDVFPYFPKQSYQVFGWATEKHR